MRSRAVVNRGQAAVSWTIAGWPAFLVHIFASVTAEDATDWAS